MVGIATGKVLQGQLHIGNIVECVLPNGSKNSFYVVELYWREQTSSHPMVFLSRVRGASDYIFAVVLDNLGYYSSCGVLRKWYFQHRLLWRFQNLVQDREATLFSVFCRFVAATQKDVVFPEFPPAASGSSSSSSSGSTRPPAAAAAAVPAPQQQLTLTSGQPASPSAESLSSIPEGILEAAHCVVVIAASEAEAGAGLQFH